MSISYAIIGSERKNWPSDRSTIDERTILMDTLSGSNKAAILAKSVAIFPITTIS
jgi:hypothetical protein